MVKGIYCQTCGVRVTDRYRAKQDPAYCSQYCEYLDSLPEPPLEFSPGAFMEYIGEWP